MSPRNEDTHLLSIDYNPIPTDDLLSSCGIGKFHYLLLLVCGIANASDAVEMLSISFVLDDVFHTFGIESGTEQGLLAAIGFAGLMTGGLVFSSLADSSFGRRRILSVALLCNTVFGTLCAFTWSTLTLASCRFLTGVGIGGCIPVVFTYFSEFFPTSQRGTWIVFLAMSWMVGSLYASGLAWILLSNTTVLGMTSWRLYFILAGLPAGIAAVSLQFFPDSPLFLFSQNRIPHANAVLSEMHRVNGIDGLLNLPEETEAFVAVSTNTLSCYQKFKNWINSIMRLFLTRTHGKLAILCTLIWFFFSFGFYGFTIWQPKYLIDRGLDSSGGLSVYATTFLTSLAQLPGSLSSAAMVKTIGTKGTLISSLFLSTIAIFVLIRVSSDLAVTISMCVFSGVSVMGWNVINIISVDMFPVDYRSTAFGVFASTGRIGSILGTLMFGLFNAQDVAFSLLLVCASMALAALCSALMPKDVSGDSPLRV